MENPIVQLVTRVPSELRRRTKIYCTQRDVTLTRFVTDAILERLRADTRAARTSRRAARPSKRSA